MLVRRTRRRGGGSEKPEPKGLGTIEPLQDSSPVDPKVHLPDAERTTQVETRPDGMVVTTYVDSPSPEWDALPEPDPEPELPLFLPKFEAPTPSPQHTTVVRDGPWASLDLDIQP